MLASKLWPARCIFRSSTCGAMPRIRTRTSLIIISVLMVILSIVQYVQYLCPDCKSGVPSAPASGGAGKCCWGDSCGGPSLACGASDWCDASPGQCSGCSGLWCHSSLVPAPKPQPSSLLSPTPQPSPAPGPVLCPTPTPRPTPRPTLRPVPRPTPSGKTPLYLALRMDDIAGGRVSDRMKESINWAMDRRVKFNFGIIAKDWPAGCVDSPTNAGCISPGVEAMAAAYRSNAVLGTTPNATIEIGSHAWDHNSWPNNYSNHSWMRADVHKARSVLTAAFPAAAIRTFTPPLNLADTNTIAALHEEGFDIVTTQGTMGCNTTMNPGGRTPPFYNYMHAPCVDWVAGKLTSCVPQGDVWSTTDSLGGFQRIAGSSVFSVPSGCQNAPYSGPSGHHIGLSATETLGEGTCGCCAGKGGQQCSIIPSAQENARKSNGLHWAVLMMHPFSQFPSGQSYYDWLDEFYEVAQQSSYDIQFINFQDFAGLRLK